MRGTEWSSQASTVVVENNGRLSRSRSRSLSQVSLLSAARYEAGKGSQRRTMTGSRYAQYIPPSVIDSWNHNRALVYVILAQFFGALMSMLTRLLETGGSHFGVMQLIFFRMGATSFLTTLYCLYTKNPEFPLGPKGKRPILALRGFVGFFGILGLYYSLMYLSLGEAIVITFLIPSCASILSSVLFHEPFPLGERISGLISLFGVVLIANPWAGNGNTADAVPITSGDGAVVSGAAGNMTFAMVNATLSAMASALPKESSGVVSVIPQATTSQRIGAVLVALIGVMGGASAYTVVRYIGKSVHPLITVNYYSVWCIIVSGCSILLFPSLGGFQMPGTTHEWIIFVYMGINGFLMQLLLTLGLGAEKSSRATNMLYTQMIFGLVLDRLVFGVIPGLWSLIGSALIITSAIYVASRKGAAPAGKSSAVTRDVELQGGDTEEEKRLVHDAEELIGSDDEEHYDVAESSRGRTRERT